MRRPSTLRGSAAAALAFVALAASALAQTRSGHAPLQLPPAHRIEAPLPTLVPATFAPIAMPSVPFRSLRVGRVAPGTRVPLARLPHLPFKGSFDTATPRQTQHGHHYRPMAATGATIDLTAGSNCGSSGALYSQGCTMTWQSANNHNVPQWVSGDTFQDYVLAPNATSATACSVALCGSSGTYTTATGTSETTTLSSQGTYMLGVYDTRARVWVSVVYVNTGAAFTLAVYQDSFHTEQSYQFDVSSSPAAYVYMQNLSTSDYYVIYVMSTSANAYCVFIAPGPASPSPGPPSPAPTGSPNSLLCNPSASSGIQAPGGNLAITWTFASTLQSGTYSVVAYDVTLGQAMGQVQVSLTGSGGKAAVLYPSDVDANASPAAPATPAMTEFAWDGTTDQSVGGVTGAVSNLPSATYTWTLTDPQGMVVGTATPSPMPTTGTGTATFTFQSLSPAISRPALYPASVWALQLYQPSTHTVIASQSFKMLGYSTETEFVSTTGTISTTLDIPCNEGNGNCNYQPTGTFNNVSSGLTITNTSDSTFPGAGDNLSEIQYSTGNAFSTAFASPPPDTGQDGIFVTVNAGSTPAPLSACSPLCSIVVADTNGASWNVNDACSNGTTVNITGSCLLTFSPVSSGTVLTPGASISVPSSKMTWYAQSGNPSWPCHASSCTTATVELPSHGITWSGTSSSSPAWTPALIGAQISTPPPTSTASLSIVGSLTCNATCSSGSTNRASPSPPPGTHYYRLNFTQADYQQSTPFQAASGREDILKFTMTNCSGCYTEYAIGFPANFSASSAYLDANQTNGWAKATCPSNLGPQFFCVSGGSNASPATIFLDTPIPVSSFTAQEFVVQGLANNGTNQWVAQSPATSTCTAIAGNGACAAFDGLGFAAYSLNSNLMSAVFQPSTVGSVTVSSPSPIPVSLVVTNTSTAADPNPDPIDAIVLEQTTSSSWKIAASPAPALSLSGWSSLSGTGYNVTGSSMEYWFGVCASQYGAPAGYPYSSPPQPPPNPASPSTPATTGVTYCSTAQEENALAAGQALTINFDLSGMGGVSGAQTFYMYAHGANGGGWSAPKPVTLTFSSESASAGFSTVNGAPVATNSVPTVGAPPNTYAYTIKNTSQSQNISTVAITLPAWDINGAAATDGTYSWQLSSLPSNPTGSGSSGCTVAPLGSSLATNTVQPVAGSANGQILITGCTAFAPGDSITVTFTASNPESQSDTYLFPSTVDGVATAATWVGDQQVQVQFSVGLTIVVNPSNPGPGGSTPVVNCPQCSFSGQTIDFGQIGSSSSVTAKDAVRATVIFGGTSSAGTWSLTVSASSNPACTGAACGSNPNELLYEVEPQRTAGNSQTGCAPSPNNATISVAAAQQAFASIPTSSGAVATGTETTCSSNYASGATGPYYDVIQSLKVQTGTEALNGNVVTLTYTLVAS